MRNRLLGILLAVLIPLAVFAIDGVNILVLTNSDEIDMEVGPSEGFIRLPQSTTPPTSQCNENTADGEAGRLYYDTDAPQNHGLLYCDGTQWRQAGAEYYKAEWFVEYSDWTQIPTVNGNCIPKFNLTSFWETFVGYVDITHIPCTGASGASNATINDWIWPVGVQEVTALDAHCLIRDTSGGLTTGDAVGFRLTWRDLGSLSSTTFIAQTITITVPSGLGTDPAFEFTSLDGATDQSCPYTSTGCGLEMELRGGIPTTISSGTFITLQCTTMVRVVR